uniref:hypothetical protein n=1 Tax=Nostoc sp. MG11 TaxID=2721166 RepID=UPI001D02C117
LAIAWLIPLPRFLALKAVALILHSLELFLVPFGQAMKDTGIPLRLAVRVHHYSRAKQIHVCITKI